MINLIPPHAQKQVRREYWIRVVSVWGFLLGSALCISAIVYAPTYVLVRSQLQNFLQEYKEANDQNQAFKDSESVIIKANEVAKLLATSGDVVSFSEVIAEIEKTQKDGIIIKTFTLSRKDDGLNPIVITGEARSRSVLTEFRDALEINPLFKSATIPLSELAKDKDIQFSLTILPKVEKP